LKRKHSVGYFSAYYRGLEVLMDMWPYIRKQVPDASLEVAYGWQSWVAIEGKNELYHRINAKFALLKPQGLTVHDRLSHEDLAKLMRRTQVWAYPTQFNEINCITALKAQEAGMIPVTTDEAALKENVRSGKVLHLPDIYEDEGQQQIFADAVIDALKHPEKYPVEPVPEVAWSDIARQWEASYAPRR
jgi:glycosyltransferase involved in cell wall biosynthesis